MAPEARDHSRIQRIAVLGAGSWGTAFAKVLGDAGRDVRILARRRQVADEIIGLDAENKTMLRSFARSATEEHKYYPVWALNFDAETYLAMDYRGPANFVREVPAVFELVEKSDAALTAHILAVDDEEIVRNAVRADLKARYGRDYQVRIVSSAFMQRPH
jgi:2-polyprenyl-6-methoxyphenol hydroxylase-like FAD-dependent oxidoreductase